jgi:hypothetical protein
VGCHMPLSSASGKVVDRAGVISVQMFDRDAIVRVDVKHEVLIGTSHAGSKAAVSAFHTNRDMIERLASAKYDSHDFITYGNGAVVSIAVQDWDPLVTGNGVKPVVAETVERKVQSLPKKARLLEKLRSARVAAS